MAVIVRRPGPPLSGLVRAIVYRAGEQPQTSVEKILPGPETGLWVNLNRDEFRSFDRAGAVRGVPGAMLAGPTSQACLIEGAEFVAVQIDPKTRFRARQDLLDRRLRLLAGPVDDRPNQPVQRRSRSADDDGHLPVSLFAKTPAAAGWQDRS